MHDMITEAQYRKQIAQCAGKAYLFFGEEDYLKNVAIRLTREALCPEAAFAFFNDITIDVTDYTPGGLIDTLAPPPMMADTRLVVLRGMDLTAMRQSETDALIAALATLAEYDYNTVILHVASGLIDEGYLPKRPSAILKKFAEVAVPVRFEASTDARLALWAGKHFAHFGVRAESAVCAELIAYSGKSMFVLANEIEKLACYVLAAGRDRVESADIRTVAVPANAVDAFALSNAILAGESREALAALAVMRFERVEPTVILGEIARTLSDMQSARILFEAGKGAPEIASLLKMHEYKARLLLRAATRVEPARLSRAIELAAAADLSLKRGASDYTAIEKLVCAL